MRLTIGLAILGLGTGSMYAIAAQGLVLIHRASGVVNFAQGGLATVGGYGFYEFSTSLGMPTIVSIVLAVLLGAAVGVALYLLILRGLHGASPVSKIVATLGLAVIIQSVVVLKYAENTDAVPSFLPTSTVDISGVHVGVDLLILFGIGVLLTSALWAIYRYTNFGRVTSASAENRLAVASLGHSPDRVACLNWAIGSGLGALSGVLLAPITFLESSQFGLLIVPVTAAAALGDFSSFPAAFFGACGIGVAESVVTRYTSLPGLDTSIPLVAVVAVLVLRGQGLPARGHVFDLFARVGTGRVRWIPTTVAVAVAADAILTVLPLDWAVPLAVTLAGACLCLSVVLVTGYAGQLSLAQLVLGGAGAFAAAKLLSANDVSFLVALVAAMVTSAILGAIVAIPALRTRGINLAICTLGLGVAVYSMVLSSGKYDGGVGGISVPSPSVLGLDLDPLLYPRRYALMALVFVVLSALVVANIRRGSAGRRLLAVRSNERAAAALGVSVSGAKIYAFMVGAAMAGIGGCMLAFLQSAILFSQFDVFTSISLVTVTVVGGVGMIGGALVGALLLPNGIVSQVLGGIPNINAWLPLVGGVSVLIAVRFAPDGQFGLTRDLVFALASRARRKLGRFQATGPPVRLRSTQSLSDPPKAHKPAQSASRGTLVVNGLDVRFGGVAAVSDMSITISPGRVHGLIGPNGAGKTTVIDALTGFVSSRSTEMRLNDQEIAHWSPQRRAKAGISRSFQTGELFTDLTVRENIAVACDDRRARRYLIDLIRPGRIHLTPEARRAVDVFGLGDSLDDTPLALPFGRRRLVGIARAVASHPSVLLLDEPAAGLDSDEAAELALLLRVLADELGIAVLLVEHNIDMVLSVADEITVMTAGGLLVAGAPPDEVINSPAVLEAYLGKGVQRRSPDANGSEPVAALQESGSEAKA